MKATRELAVTHSQPAEWLVSLTQIAEMEWAESAILSLTHANVTKDGHVQDVIKWEVFVTPLQ